MVELHAADKEEHPQVCKEVRDRNDPVKAKAGTSVIAPGWTTQSHGISCYSQEINLLIRVHQHDFAIFFVSHRTILKAM